MKFPSQALEEGNVSRLNQLMEDAQIKNYLANNPDFLIKNPQLLSHMELNHGFDQTTSLVERQVKVLRERNQALQSQLIEMLQAAQSNETLLLKCNHFMLELLACENLQDLCYRIRNRLKKDFNLDDASLILVGNYPEVEHAQVFSNNETIKSLFKCQFPDSVPLCGRVEEAPRRALFGDLGDQLESFALIPLGGDCEYGLLALASRDVSRFDPSMGTTFIELIAKLVAHLTKSYELK